MENKKGGAGVVVAIVLAVIFIAGIIFLVFFLKGQGFFQPKPEQVPSIPMFVMPRDANTLEPVEAQYLVEYQDKDGNRIVSSQGKLDDSWNELSVPRDSRITLICWSDDYYLVKAHKDHTPTELATNKSVFTCDMEKIGNITVEHSGEIRGRLDKLYLNVSTPDNFYKTSMCFAWTSGFLDVGLVNQYAICDTGGWLNWSEYDPVTLEFTYLQNNTYRCGEDWFETCEFAQGTKCKTTTETIPIRFKGLVDDCVYTGNSIHGSYEFELEVESFDYKNDLDYIDVYIYDKDRRWDITEMKWLWKSEMNGEDIASPDLVYRINYGDCDNGYCPI